MTTRVHRLWQPGNTRHRVFLPNFWVALVRPRKDEYLTPNTVKMTASNVREYMSKVYSWPVRQVTTKIEPGRMYYSTADKWARRALEKEHDTKVAFVTLREDVAFEFPNCTSSAEIIDEMQSQMSQLDEADEAVAKQKGVQPRDLGSSGSWFSL